MKFKQLIYWLEHLFYISGMMYLNFLKLDFKNAIDAYYWTKIHLSCPGHCTKTKMKFKVWVEVTAVTCLGIAVPLIASYLIYLLFKKYHN